jgi:putative CocE/NonD family hydrolase
MRRFLLLTVAVATLATGFSSARADIPVVSNPPLRSDTHWVVTPWGYKLDTLNLNPAPPAGYPADYRWPTLYETEGYGGAGKPNAYVRMDDGELMALNISFGRGPRADYAYVKASVRGTECSGGFYNLYDRRHAFDGYNIVEWIAAQSWSDTHVGLHGSSLSGQTAYWIATTKPPHLDAVSANLLHSDIYRDIFMVGGVQNILFPTAWTYGMGVSGPHRAPLGALQNGAIPNDEICVWNNTVSKGNNGDLPQPENEAIFAGVRSVDDDWYRAHAAMTYADTIKIPYYQQANWQDEQVGPRGMILWKHIHPTPVTVRLCGGGERTLEPKFLAVGSGDHGWGQYHNRDLWSFLDTFLLGKPDCSGLTSHRVMNYWEKRSDSPDSTYTAAKYGDDWPLPGTTWAKSYLHAGNSVSFGAPTAADAGSTDTYLSGIAHQNWFYDTPQVAPDVYSARKLPDTVEYVSPAVGTDPGMPLDDRGNFTIAGPIMMNLYASMLGTDADFFVSISDLWPDGSVSYLQRGWLKASHKQVDPLRSYYANDAAHTMVIPYMPHTNPQPVMPGEIDPYTIEIFPLGHIFRPGHRILVQVHTPPSVDGLWGYTPTHHQPAAVTLYHDAAHPSWIQWPAVTPDEWTGAPAVAGCQIPGGFPCNPPSVLTR